MIEIAGESKADFRHRGVVSADHRFPAPQALSYREPPTLKKARKHCELTILVKKFEFRIIRCIYNPDRIPDVRCLLQKSVDVIDPPPFATGKDQSGQICFTCFLYFLPALKKFQYVLSGFYRAHT